MFDPELTRNRALTEQACAFHPPYPERIGDFWGGVQVPTGAVVQQDGSVIFRIYAPEARAVRTELTAFRGVQIPMKRNEDGFFEGRLPYDARLRGPQDVRFYVDGLLYLHPQMPAHYRSFRQVNYVEIPDPESEMILLRDVPHGQVVREVYRSRVRGDWQRMLLYLPPQYRRGGAYPVLYLQHGLTENENEWVNMGRVNYLLDNLLAEGKCTPFIVAMCDGMERLPGEGDRDFGSFERMLLEECIPFVEENYRVLPGRENRAMAGLSMGSMQAAMIGMAHPEVFGSLGLFSGFMHAHDIPSYEAAAHLRPLTQDSAYLAKNWRVFFRSMGSEDVYFSTFARDTATLESLGCRAQPGYHERVYEGFTHDWGAFRRAMRDFSQLIFR